MRQSRMGLIQTVDQLKFSYMAIAEGARRANLISSDSAALSVIMPPPPNNTSTYNKHLSGVTVLGTANLPGAYGSLTSRVDSHHLESSSSSDSSSDFDYGLGNARDGAWVISYYMII